MRIIFTITQIGIINIFIEQEIGASETLCMQNIAYATVDLHHLLLSYVEIIESD